MPLQILFLVYLYNIRMIHQCPVISALDVGDPGGKCKVINTALLMKNWQLPERL
jgi:hypothetical protein